ncbi:MAG: argininosuccinate synthase [Candidatus Omnitrophica bacterium]|nr:argininosuccinate synthase [Candidatus Omnitrophota bacterium]
MKPRVVLAYSGGLDTSVCVRWLIEKGYRVVAFCADLGQGEDLGPARKRALALGAERVVIQDLREEFAREYVLPALQAGAVYEGKYLLATALSRPLIARHLAETARRFGAACVAHGCTGKGNDQVRLEVSLRVLNPRIRVIAPVREWKLRSRPEEVRYLASRKLPVPGKSDSRYSIDQNLWGVSIESGPLEDPWVEPPSSAFRWTKDPARAKAKSQVVQVDFARGVPVRVNGRAGKLTALIARLNRVGAGHGIGRTDLVEDRLVGIKSREVYEAPAATLLHAAHRELEQLTLDRETLAFKEGVAQRYARMIYDGLWFTPLRNALDAFVRRTQERVTGSVRLRLYRGGVSCAGRRSPRSLYSRKLATYEGGEDLFDQKAAAGFIALWGLPYIGQSR